jgi:hypothetical protein
MISVTPDAPELADFQCPARRPAGPLCEPPPRRCGTDWNRRSRRHRVVRPGTGPAHYPGTYTPHPVIPFVPDNSASMSAGDFTAVTAEIVGIAGALGIRGRGLRVLDVDARVHEFTEHTGQGVGGHGARPRRD